MLEILRSPKLSLAIFFAFDRVADRAVCQALIMIDQPRDNTLYMMRKMRAQADF